MSKNTNKPTYILGLSFYYHDSAAALIKDGVVIAAVQEERFTRKKHDDSFPRQSITFCLEQASITVDDLDYIVFYEKPILKLERLLKTYIFTWPRGILSFSTAMLSLFGKKIWIENRIRKETQYQGEVLFTKHHVSHAASAFFCSPFEEAAVITIDGVGEWDTTTIAHGNKTALQTIKTIPFPHSLGLLYSAITQFIGFKVNSAEYKVMGLAPYGNPDRFYSQFKKLITIQGDGSYNINRAYFSYEYGMKMTNKKLEKLLGVAMREPESALQQVHKDIAAALQKITEEVVVAIAQHAKDITGSKHVCLAGGVALNCVANGKLLLSGIFDDMYIQPASGDAGSAVGSALYVYHHVLKHERVPSTAMRTVYLGPEYDDDHICRALDEYSLRYEMYNEDVLYDAVASLIEGTNSIGWFQGKMEYGPRALGNRSIIADPRNEENWQKINLKIKYRESFRPFAPAVLAEHTQHYFALEKASPYMLLVADVINNSVPAITHIDGSARIQTVHKESNRRFHTLITAFYEKTGCPLVINTSFNVRGEPIVMTPHDAINSFINTEMDYLVMGTTIVSRKENQSTMDTLRNNTAYLNTFELD